METKTAESRDMITIEGKAVRTLTYKGMRVLTLAMLDEIHGKAKRTALRAFLRYKDQLKKGVDYIEAVPAELEQDKLSQNLDCDKLSQSSYGGHRRGMVLITAHGYLLFAKVFTDAKAWKIQRMLVDNYFRVHADGGATAAPQPVAPAPVELVPAAAAGIRYLMADHGAVRVFTLPDKGECLLALDINKGCGKASSAVNQLKRDNPLAEKIVFNFDPSPEMLITLRVSHGPLTAVRVQDVAALSLCMRGPAVSRFARAVAEYCAGIGPVFFMAGKCSRALSSRGYSPR